MYERILVPVEGSAPSRKGLDEAIKLAKSSGARLKLVHVVDEFIIEAGYISLVSYQRLTPGVEQFRHCTSAIELSAMP
jgi:nucleotide-binding universal stress UspA family protein